MLLGVYGGLVPWPEGLIDEEDDWEELQQLEGLGQGEPAVICVTVCVFVIRCVM
jgi:hypothetical protein